MGMRLILDIAGVRKPVERIARDGNVSGGL
jgi:hypothetical protein